MKFASLLLTLALCTVAASAGNLVQNGDFSGAVTEADSLTVSAATAGQWYAYTGKFSSADGYGRCIGAYPDSNGPDVDLVQAVPMPAAGVYDLSFDFIDTQTAALSFDGNRRAIIWLSLYGVNEGQVRDLYYMGGTHDGASLIPDGMGIAGDWAGPGWANLPPTGGWTSFSTQVDTTGWQGYDYLYIAFGCYGNEVAGGEPQLGIDNVQLVPEPATLSLLGLGFAALLRRRR